MRRCGTVATAVSPRYDAHSSTCPPPPSPKLRFFRRSSRGSGFASASGNPAATATESELDDDDEEPFERPKLSYKSSKKKSGRNNGYTVSERRAVKDLDDREEVPTTTLNAMHSTSRSHVMMPTTAGRGEGARGGGGGEYGDEDEPFERPKLSYGGGVFRSSSGAQGSSSRG